MNEELWTIIGIKEVTTKNGTQAFNYYYSTDFTDYEKKSATMIIGVCCDKIYTSVFCNVNIGDKVRPLWGSYVFNGERKAVLRGFEVVSGK